MSPPLPPSEPPNPSPVAHPLRSATTTITPVTVGTFLRTQPPPWIVWKPPFGPLVATGGAVHTITTAGPDRFQDAITSATTPSEPTHTEPPGLTRPRYFGGAAFHASPTPGPPWSDFPAAAFVLPHAQYTQTTTAATLTVHTTPDTPDTPGTPGTPGTPAREHLRDIETRLTTSHPGGSPTGRPRVTTTHRNPTRDRWTAQVTAALERITAGTLQKLVLAQSLEATVTDTPDLFSLLTSLLRSYPDCYVFFYAPSETVATFGASPERLVHRRGTTVRTEALAGTTPRGDTPPADTAHARHLRTSPKHQHEHRLVADAIHTQLAPFTDTLTEGTQRVRKLDSVHHLHTPIHGTLTTDTHVLSLVDALHPTPAVGGLPPDPAQAAIREIETFDRGWYAGPIGWFDPAGNGDFAVSIRSAIATDHTLTLYAGAGIVPDSEPTEEWDEIQLKFHPILNTLRQ